MAWSSLFTGLDGIIEKRNLVRLASCARDRVHAEAALCLILFKVTSIGRTPVEESRSLMNGVKLICISGN